MIGLDRSSNVLEIADSSIDYKDDKLVMALTNLWRFILTDVTYIPRILAAEKIVELTWYSDTSFPITTTEGTIIDSLNSAEKYKLFDYIINLIGEDRASVGGSCLAEFGDDLI